VEACSFLPARAVRPFGVSSSRGTIATPLHPELPNCFAHPGPKSSPTGTCAAHWRRRSYRASLASQPELAAPFVAEVGRAIRLQELDRQSIRTALMRERIVEPTYDTAGGPDYIAVRNAMEQSQDRYISFLRTEARSAVLQSGANRNGASPGWLLCDSPTPHAAGRAGSERSPASLLVPKATSRGTGRRLLRRLSGRFDSVPDEPHRTSVVVARVFPLSATSVSAVSCSRRDVLGPSAHAFAPESASRSCRRKSPNGRRVCRTDGAGMVPGHYRMLADRAAAKARSLLEWYETCAPGYLTDEDVRGSLHSRLISLLDSRDPWKPLVSGRMIESEHWRN
jgi:hypothetical protein